LIFDRNKAKEEIAKKNKKGGKRIKTFTKIISKMKIKKI